MENQILSFEEIKKLFPDEWVLLGNPDFTNTEILSGIVIMHNKEKMEIIKNHPNWRANFDTATTVFTGIFPKKRYLL